MRFALLGLLIALPLISAADISAADPRWASADWVVDGSPTCMKDCAVQVGSELVHSWQAGPEDDRICGDYLENDAEASCACRDEGFSKMWGQCIYAKCSETEVEVTLEAMKMSCKVQGIVYNEDAFKAGKDSGVGRSRASLGLVGIAAVGAVMVVL